MSVNDYDLLRDYLKKQWLPEFVLSFERIWWETLRSPREKMPQREACLEGGYIATRQVDGKSVRLKRMK